MTDPIRLKGSYHARFTLQVNRVCRQVLYNSPFRYAQSAPEREVLRAVERWTDGPIRQIHMYVEVPRFFGTADEWYG